MGMHGSLHINPYYGKTSNTGVLAHFESVLPFGPTIVYNVPPWTAQDIQPCVIEEIAKVPNFAGVKECIGNSRITGYSKQGLAIWSRSDVTMHSMYGRIWQMWFIYCCLRGILHTRPWVVVVQAPFNHNYKILIYIQGVIVVEELIWPQLSFLILVQAMEWRQTVYEFES